MQKESPPAPSRPPSSGNEPAKRIASTDLFGETREIVIEHAGRTYRLRITQNGKLILTA